ncbi:uncharacterized protein LOC108864444 [Galendromus occidentalis]|uniref:Uncharacterized protein LOC108864444 n=1 Tax=Galendromus occidentalis TaxID=34638 RepID=A0AAJ7L6L2_9ACAR|nr:uncharacterized protein LOC108864444 [Galendromus occidentalis]
MSAVSSVTPATVASVAAPPDGTIDPYSKDAINQLFRRQPQRFRFVSKFNAKSASWKDFELVYLDNHLKDFARCVHCKSFVTYSSKKGTGGMLRHRCVGKDGPASDGDSPPAKKSSTAAAPRNLSPRPLTLLAGTPAPRPVNGVCALLNIPKQGGTPIQTILYNPEQGLRIQNLAKLGLTVQKAARDGKNSPPIPASAVTNVSITKVLVPEVKTEVRSDDHLSPAGQEIETATRADRVMKEEKLHEVNGVEQIVSNVEIHEDISYDAPSSISDDPRNGDFSLLTAPAEVQLADLQVRHEIEEHNARMELYKKKMEIVEMKKEFWKSKLKELKVNF